MNRHRRSCRFPVVSFVFMSAMAAVVFPVRAEMGPSEDRPVNCGVFALYTLLRLEGQHSSVDVLMNRLAGGSPRGESMRDLQKVASALGLSLRGVHLDLDAVPPRRPAIVYLRRGEHGHFVVIRAVGHTGELVQVLDSLSEPIVIDRRALVLSEGWTGIGLVKASWSPMFISGLVIVVLGLGWLAWARLGHRSWVRRGVAATSPTLS
ncbi:hypothetical protein BH23PLA1_BH23PLA1_21850 [soil metagenome]